MYELLLKSKEPFTPNERIRVLFKDDEFITKTEQAVSTFPVIDTFPPKYVLVAPDQAGVVIPFILVVKGIVPVAVALHPFPDLSFHWVTFVPPGRITVAVSAASNQNLDPEIWSGLKRGVANENGTSVLVPPQIFDPQYKRELDKKRLETLLAVVPRRLSVEMATAEELVKIVLVVRVVILEILAVVS